MSAWLLMAALAVAGEGEPAEAPAVAQQTKRALPAVVGDLALKAGRVEVAPIAALSFRDSFFRKYVVGAEVNWHVRETVSLGVWGGYSITQEARTMHVCDATGCTVPTLKGTAPGNLLFVSGFDVQWAPFYGKLSFLSESFGNIDVHLRVGVAAVGYQSPELKLGIGGRAGLGARYFFTRWLALRVDLDDLLYTEQVTKLGIVSTQLRNQLFFSVGVAFFINAGPTS